MPSILPNFTYDIFISYRQKDNKYDGWVTRFVENLKKELEATFKEDVSIYFDVNPQDGLLESHEVADSLKMKLNCLIFIPVISQTYCDPKSFAWEHEFKDFVEIASKDQFGLKVKLLNGNIASRILPVRIHDLKPEDIELFELVAGGSLRGIEFTYKSLGVNRPLRENEDHAQDNLNKTYYRDQINKTAHAINDTISALIYNSSRILEQNTEKIHTPPVDVVKLNRPKPRGLSQPIKLGVISIVLILLLVFSVYRISTGKNRSEEILERVISYYDYNSKWADYYGKVHVVTTSGENNKYEEVNPYEKEIIEINTKENYYKSTGFTKSDTIIKGIKNGKCFIKISGNNNPDSILIKKLNLDSLDIKQVKEHHYWLFGGVMFLKYSGLDLEKKVRTTKFQGYKCYSLTFSSDSNKIKNPFFRSTKWVVYVNQEDYTLVGYRCYGVFGARDEYITCRGKVNINGIIMPKLIVYYSGLDNSIDLIDVFQRVE